MFFTQFLVPDYFDAFRCKCDECRHPCCDGWGINVAEHEYFSLIGIACSPRLRHKLDDAFVISDRATEESFASIRPNYLEQCPMLDDDGLCLLQKEKGEDVMPVICRVYPRAVRKYGEKHEACTSCSCERTVELLLATDAPLSLHRTEASIPFDGLPVYGDDPEKDRLRYEAVEIMGNFSTPIVTRLECIAKRVIGIETKDFSLSRDDSVRSAVRLLSLLADGSRSMAVVAEPALAFLGDADDVSLPERFDVAEDAFYRAFPDAEKRLGRVIANHLYYESFPFVPDCEAPDTAFAAFCTAVSLLKVLLIAGTVGNESIDVMVDTLAYANRFIEHSDFYRVCSRLDHPTGADVLARFAPMLNRK